MMNDTASENENEQYTPTQEEKNLAMFCHLGAFAGFIIPFGGLLVPLIIWLTKKDESEYVDYHGKESVNFQLSMLIAFIVAGLLVFVIIGIPLLFVLAIYELVVVIIAGIKASEGKYYRYPWSFRFIQ